MNRLSLRLVIAMLVVAVVSLVVVPVAQILAARQTIQSLTADFRERVETHTHPRGFSSGRTPQRENSLNNRQFLIDENTRLLDLLSDYRSAQSRAVLFGSLGAFLLAVMLASWLSRGIAQPIEAVSRAASDLARGDLASQVSLRHFEHHTDEAKELADTFNAMAEALERSEGERKAMIADIAHELRNPLATMQLRLDALADGLIRFSEGEAKLLRGQVGLLARLIDDLRMLSLADAGRLSLNVAPVNLNDLLQTVIRANQDKAAAAGVNLLHAPPPQALLVSGDTDRLAQVVNNLLDNALRVTPRGGRIEVALDGFVTEVRLKVQDTGPGIPEDEIETVFERFVQGKRCDTNSTTGSGLGLAIVQALVKLHGGRVRASNHAEGALFEVRLPCHTAAGTV